LKFKREDTTTTTTTGFNSVRYESTCKPMVIKYFHYYSIFQATLPSHFLGWLFSASVRLKLLLLLLLIINKLHKPQIHTHHVHYLYHSSTTITLKKQRPRKK